MTEIDYQLPELPNGWVWNSLDYIADIVTGTTPPKVNLENYGDKIPFIKPGDLDTNKPVTESLEYLSEIGSKKARIIPSNSIMVTCIGATIGKTGISGRAAVTNQQINSLIPGKALVPRYAYYYCLSNFFQDQVKSNASSTTLPILNKSKFSALVLPVAPLTEQHRIVTRIEELFSRLDAGIDGLKKVKIQLRLYRQSVLKSAVEGRLTEEWRKAHPEVEPAGKLLGKIIQERKNYAKKRLKDTIFPDPLILPEIPNTWTWATVEQLGPPDRTIAYGVLQPGPDVVNGIPLIRVGDINGGKVKLTNLKRIDPKIALEYERTKLKGGEVLITLVGAIGRTAVVPGILAGANTARAVGVIPLSNHLRPPWVEIWFRNPDKIDEITSKAHEVARKTLNLEDVRSAPVAIPPQAEQDEIINEVESKLSLAENAEQIIDMSQRRCEKLRQSILKQAFKGNLVPQDPSDEPASVLLGRTKAERPRKESGKDKQSRLSTLNDFSG